MFPDAKKNNLLNEGTSEREAVESGTQWSDPWLSGDRVTKVKEFIFVNQTSSGTGRMESERMKRSGEKTPKGVLQPENSGTGRQPGRSEKPEEQGTLILGNITVS
ncbi:hypothetical protein K7J14_02500 [Treponema zuelzerae]|uniref:Uncharacterized protein n=1 Tax=Teretinema zuelzerae TaxID=156 RepID=A0AAE3EGT6_9SPIR|nr:hypothetical protein [Teretinema zuelzerae]MCD1653568.1 hypothetical protein [Teretinema zuelzerae]